MPPWPRAMWTERPSYGCLPHLHQCNSPSVDTPCHCQTLLMQTCQIPSHLAADYKCCCLRSFVLAGIL